MRAGRLCNGCDGLEELMCEGRTVCVMVLMVWWS
jgi:hypothetical protein